MELPLPISQTPHLFSKSHEETSEPCIQRVSKKRFLTGNLLTAFGIVRHEPPPHQLRRSIARRFCGDRGAVGVLTGRSGGIARREAVPP